MSPEDKYGRRVQTITSRFRVSKAAATKAEADNSKDALLVQLAAGWRPSGRVGGLRAFTLPMRPSNTFPQNGSTVATKSKPPGFKWLTAASSREAGASQRSRTLSKAMPSNKRKRSK